jgi:thiol-disulfide isomerase/thioredoxin
MTPRAKIWLGAVAAIVLGVGLYYLNARWIMPATMHKVKAAGNHPIAPDFSLTDINGARLALSEYRGKVVLLDFWATWCGPCRIEIPEFVQMEQKYRDQGFAVLGVAMQDTPSAVSSFYQQFHLNYPVAVGNSQVASLYGGIFGLPTSFLIGRDGRIYSQHSGTTGPDVFQDEIAQLLAAKPGEEVPGFSPAGQVEEIEVGTPGEANAEVPGVDITKLTPAQLVAFEKQLDQHPCNCGGCKFTLLQCRRQDATCAVSKKLARDMLQKLQEEKTSADASPKT